MKPALPPPLELIADVLDRYPQNTGTPRAGGVSSSSYHILEVSEALGKLSTSAESLIISQFIALLPGECAATWLHCPLCTACPRAANYKSGFATVSSTVWLWSLILLCQRSKDGVVLWFCVFLQPGNPLPALPLSLRIPDCAAHLTLL